jgi:transcriptional regulator with XRE-family HTH domain
VRAEEDEMSWILAFGVELRRLRRDAGVSLSELARRVHYSKGHLSKVENGRARPNRVLAALCDQEFSTGGALTALVPHGATRRRRNVLLEIRTRIAVTVGLPTHPVTEDLRLAMLLDIPEVATECAAPDIGDAITTLCCALRLHGLCGDRCVFVDLLPAIENDAGYHISDYPVGPPDLTRDADPKSCETGAVNVPVTN